tara:strand:- start:109 stop:468 length:360 start_codon:yes stop_codon:yes gene_type:complete
MARKLYYIVSDFNKDTICETQEEALKLAKELSDNGCDHVKIKQRLEKTREYTKTGKYPNGYIPKIEYHLGRLQKALDEKNWSQYYRSLETLKYFSIKQLYLLDDTDLPDIEKLNKSIEE